MKQESDIHYLAGSTIPSESADSVHVMRMTQALQQLHGNTTLFCKSGTDEAIASYYGIEAPFKIVRSHFRTRLDLFSYFRAMSAMPKPQLALGRYAYGSWWSTRRSVPTLYEVHAPASGIKKLVEERVFNSPSFLGLIAITQALADEYCSRYPALAQRCLVLPDAANDPGPSSAPGTQGPLTVGYVGSWYPGRGIELIVAMARKEPLMRFIVAGGERSQLIQMGLRPPDNLECKGYIAPSAVDALLGQTDVLLAPYAHQVSTGFGAALDTTRWCSPMKLFEYMAHGKAIICADLPVLREVMADSENCLLVEPNHTESWQAALARLDEDRALAAKLGANARAQFLEHHTWSDRAKRALAFAQHQLDQR